MLGKVSNTALRIFSARQKFKRITRRLKRAKNSAFVLKSTCFLEGEIGENGGYPPLHRKKLPVFDTLPCIRKRHHIELKQNSSIFVHFMYISKASSSCKRLRRGTYSLGRLEKSLEGDMGGKLLEYSEVEKRKKRGSVVMAG